MINKFKLPYYIKDFIIIILGLFNINTWFNIIFEMYNSKTIDLFGACISLALFWFLSLHGCCLISEKADKYISNKIIKG